MDLNIESPFSFDLGEELFPLPSLSSIDIPIPPLESNTTVISHKLKNGRRSTSDDIGDECITPTDHKKKKIIHRDVERQRRQEMSSLYTTLRSLLPIEYLKGKRSICDHMQETVKYILYMQNKIQQLSDKRDELKKLIPTENYPTTDTVETINNSQSGSVVVRRRDGPGGVQVILYTPTQHRLHLSKILQALVVEGLEIISCISTKINNDRFLHTIESQVVVTSGCDRSIDVLALQHKLSNLKCFSLD